MISALNKKIQNGKLCINSLHGGKHVLLKFNHVLVVSAKTEKKSKYYNNNNLTI